MGVWGDIGSTFSEAGSRIGGWLTDKGGPSDEQIAQASQLPGFQDRQNRLQGYEQGAQGRQATQASTAGLRDALLAKESPFRNDQSALVDMLRRQAGGQDSMAALQARQANNRAVAQQQALAASARPGMGAMAARNAAMGMSRLQSGLANQEAQARLAERLGATQALGSVLQGARGQDLQNAQFNAQAQNAQNQMGAQLDQQTRLFNAQAQNQQAAQNDQYLLALLQQQYANAQGQQQGNLAGLGVQMQRESQPSNWQAVLGGVGSVLSLPGMGGGGGGYSGAGNGQGNNLLDPSF
jgi:hypothetical protein